ncbi:hypothetical protein N802_14150 [Knoellia sinensis KCTC 19936]|uniref:Uncharacterized protein n=1 Tax=Knoellia sinensis KCTC 19936 TaxID=1385520 RepID=A0A0A0J7N3_9MICO|nr:hypothetical protein [Knoellia sinensis]KGN33188.1 hypothetical protein N802_14150 [Knoellia sinensis KCTC 19936]
MRSPRDCALESERHPQLPAGTDERVSGYGVMGQPFASGHVLGLRRWTASSVGEQFTSIWHRDPDDNWHFYESAQPEFACSRWFGHGVQESTVVDIDVTWEGSHLLRVTSPPLVDWTLTLASSPMTRVMSAVARPLPLAAWRSPALLRAMGTVASSTLGVGKVGMTGLTANGLPFDANPQRIWRVVDATAQIQGQDAGPPAPLPEQARLGDFWIPQHGVFAMGRVFIGA